MQNKNQESRQGIGWLEPAGIESNAGAIN